MLKVGKVLDRPRPGPEEFSSRDEIYFKFSERSFIFHWGPSNPRSMFTPDKYCQYYIILITKQISPDPLNKNS